VNPAFLGESKGFISICILRDPSTSLGIKKNICTMCLSFFFKVDSLCDIITIYTVMSKQKIQPLGDRVLVKPTSKEDKKTKSGIILPETIDKEKPDQGKVIAVGVGKMVEGELVPLKVKVGDIVIFSKYSPDEVKIDDEDYYILREENILAIIK